MYNIIKNVFFVVIFFTFLFLITKYYFSEKNKILTNKSRSSYELILNNGKKDLPVLKNDTNNVIVYVKDLENYKKKRKKRFWEKLISNDN
tara:strand:- start:1316 stop:1585 length:270 start_codon:yes stop_codon:yes gene_type:complete